MYQGLHPLDPDLQDRHEARQRMLAATMTMHEAVMRYGVSSRELYKRLVEAGCWPAVKGRWWREDVEAVLQ